MRSLGIVGISPRTFKEGDMYLCTIKDEHSKKVLGWSIADHCSH
jgi:hypothetical protein